MSNFDHIPSLASLALQYGTITKKQYKQIVALTSGEKKSRFDEAEILLKQGLATRYQIELLKLIRDYQIIRKKGEEFAKIAVEKGFASQEEVKKAFDLQKKSFRESRIKKLMGDILVESKIISPDQKILILREQTRLNKKIRKNPEEDTEPGVGQMADSEGLDLSAYEKEFLKIKALDEDFSAAVIERGLAKDSDITKAKTVQEDAFGKQGEIKAIGDILVELKIISQDQKNTIYLAQGRSDELSVPMVTVKISSDQMTAWLHVKTRTDAMPAIEDIKQVLNTAGVRSGLYPDPMLQSFLDHKMMKIPGANLDYSEVLREASGLESFVDVVSNEKGEKRKGEVLVRQSMDWTLVAQENVLGKLSESISDKDFTVRCGHGTRWSRNRDSILAAKSGCPALSIERFLYIHPIIHVLEDADLKYGPIEPFANLTISGTLTGAYKVSAGFVKAREIRGARIEAIGDIRSEVGITDSVIKSQGDIYARYIHNCRIETFGSIYVENEIFDSLIKCSGKINSPGCRAVSSELYAKAGVSLAGAGSERTSPCIIAAGREDHLFSQIEPVMSRMESVHMALDRIKKKKEAAVHQSKRAFERMIDLKIFYDRAKASKEMLKNDYTKNSGTYSPKKLKKMADLMTNFEKRMATAVLSLKELNQAKKKSDKTVVVLSGKIDKLLPKVNEQIKELEKTLFAYLEWARPQPVSPEIEIKGTGYQGTRFKGIYSEIQLNASKTNFKIQEEMATTGKRQMRVEESYSPEPAHMHHRIPGSSR